MPNYITQFPIEVEEFDPAEIQEQISYLQSDLETKADVNGSYPSLTAGLAEQLLSSNRVTDQTPYIYRQTALGKANATRALMKKIVGGSVVWNQLSDNSVPPTSRNELTITATDGGFTINGTASASTSATGWFRLSGSTESYLRMSGHKVLVAFNLLSGTATAAEGVANAIWFGLGGGTGTVYLGTPKIIVPSLDSSNNCSLNASNGAVFTNAKFSILVFDLTAMFGTTIADYIYSIEQATAGSGIAKLREWGFFDEDYYEYDAGTMKSVEGVSAKTTRDVDANVIGNYPLDSSLTLRGISKLDSDNELYYDGDEYAADGTVTRRYGIVDLGTLNYSYSGSNFWFYTLTLETVTPSSNDDIANILSPLYTTTSRNAMFADLTKDKLIGINRNGTLQIRDLTYTDPAAFKSAMSGVYLVYELATPTTETAEPYTEVQVVDTDGTEEFVTTGIVPVGHVTEYPENLLDKLQHLPDLASADGDYIIRQTGTQMSLVTASGGGGGAVSSVNGKTGAVVLDADDVGAIASPSSPASGAFLVWNGSAWVAQTLAVWNGGSF